jgi:CHAT domain-containing protein
MRYRLIHFATHGRLDLNTPHLSGLMLADGAVLNVYEILGLRLDADLVALSACDTGSGKVTGGNDIVGLPHAFLGAGARALIVSLWPVDDWSTELTMQRMYEELRRGLRPAAALRAAQLALRSMTTEEVGRNYGAAVPVAHPLHWAPLVVIGPI